MSELLWLATADEMRRLREENGRLLDQARAQRERALRAEAELWAAKKRIAEMEAQFKVIGRRRRSMRLFRRGSA